MSPITYINSKKIEMAEELLDSNVYSINEVAELLGYSSIFSFSRDFKKYTGKTIFDYIREVRIAQAKHLLRTSSHTIADIGIFCGYPSVSSFQRAFQAEEGMSPGEFRERGR